MKQQLCLNCNEPVNLHTRGMQVVSARSAPPKRGGKLNLFDCIAKGGPKRSRFSRSPQQGEGVVSIPPRQMS